MKIYSTLTTQQHTLGLDFFHISVVLPLIKSSIPLSIGHLHLGGTILILLLLLWDQCYCYCGTIFILLLWDQCYCYCGTNIVSETNV